MTLATCDLPHDTSVPAADCHGGELHYCEPHCPVVLAAFRAGVLGRPDCTIDDAAGQAPGCYSRPSVPCSEGHSLYVSK